MRPVVLASASPTRARLLAAAGVPVDIVPSAVNETAIKELGRSSSRPVESVALALAEAKALAVAANRPDALVIGADQMLDLDGRWLDKPTDLEAAAAQLRQLSGRPHRLIAAVAVAEGGRIAWTHGEAVRLVMRPLGRAVIDRYLAAEGADVLSSVGAYRLEGLGAQLFEAVEGDFFAVLGLPLLPLLGYLRRAGVLPA